MLASIKEKIRRHLDSSDTTLKQLFMFLDKDDSKAIDMQELKKGLSSKLSDNEIEALF